MSWQDYVDKQLLASGFVNHAAIIGSDGALWAKSASFDVSITRTVCHFFVSFCFLHFDSSVVAIWKLDIVRVRVCMPKNVSDRRVYAFPLADSILFFFSCVFFPLLIGARGMPPYMDTNLDAF